MRPWPSSRQQRKNRLTRTAATQRSARSQPPITPVNYGGLLAGLLGLQASCRATVLQINGPLTGALSFLGGRAEYPTIPGEPKKGLQIGQALIMVGHGNGQGGRPFEGLGPGPDRRTQTSQAALIVAGEGPHGNLDAGKVQSLAELIGS